MTDRVEALSAALERALHYMPEGQARQEAVRALDAARQSPPLDVETLLSDTEALPEDAPVTGMGGTMYAAGWTERAEAILARLAVKGEQEAAAEQCDHGRSAHTDAGCLHCECRATYSGDEARQSPPLDVERAGVWSCVCGVSWLGTADRKPDDLWAHYRFRCADGAEPEVDHNPNLATFRPDSPTPAALDVEALIATESVQLMDGRDAIPVEALRRWFEGAK